MSYLIEPMQDCQWPQVAEIYAQGIATNSATLEAAAPSKREFDEKFLRECRLVALHGEQVIGWTVLSRVSKRAVYKGVAEVSIYVAANWRGKGVGKGLLTELIHKSERFGFWTLQVSVFPENTSSINLHLKHGFRKVGVREKIGKRPDGTWQDTLLMERRSPEQ